MNSVSLIVPIYNNYSTLRALFRMIRQQTYPNLEVILIDDGSTDGSGALCDRWQASHQELPIYVVHQDNQGLSAARNQGIATATGTWLTFVDADDQITPDYVAYLYGLTQKHACLLATCNHQVVRGQKSRPAFTVNAATGAVTSHNFLENLLYQQHFDVSSWGKLYHHSLFQAVTYPVGQLFEDTATTFELVLKAQKVAYGNKVQYHYMIRPQSITTTTFDAHQLDYLTATKLMIQGILQVYPDLKIAAAQRLTYAYISVLTKSFNGPQNDTAVKTLQLQLRQTILQRKQTLLGPRVAKRTKISVQILQYFGVDGLRFFWDRYNWYRNR